MQLVQFFIFSFFISFLMSSSLLFFGLPSGLLNIGFHLYTFLLNTDSYKFKMKCGSEKASIGMTFLYENWHVNTKALFFLSDTQVMYTQTIMSLKVSCSRWLSAPVVETRFHLRCWFYYSTWYKYSSTIAFCSSVCNLQARRKTAKSDFCFVLSVCLSVRMKQFDSHGTDFHGIWYLSIF